MKKGILVLSLVAFSLAGFAQPAPSSCCAKKSESKECTKKEESKEVAPSCHKK